MSLKNRLTLVIILVLIITMGILTVSSINNVNSVFSLEKLSSISENHNSFSIEEYSGKSVPIQRVLSSSRNVFNIKLIIIFIMLILLSSLVIFTVVTYSLRSLSNLQKKMKNVNIDSLGEEIKIVKSDPSEIKALTLSFNKMSKNLNNTFLKQKLFLHNAAHEFRTPLAIISTYSQLLKMDLSDKQRQEKEMITTILQNCNHLEEMLTQLLLLAEDKQIELNDLIDIRQLLKKAKHALVDLSTEKNMNIKIKVPDELFIQGNKNLLFITFKNLIENSIKYGESNSEIIISTTELDKQVNLIITNKLISPSDLDSSKIFDAFNRGNTINNSISGQGLGLAIVKNIILQHSGQVNYKIYNSYVTFTVNLRKRV